MKISNRETAKRNVNKTFKNHSSSVVRLLVPILKRFVYVSLAVIRFDIFIWVSVRVENSLWVMKKLFRYSFDKWLENLNQDFNSCFEWTKCDKYETHTMSIDYWVITQHPRKRFQACTVHVFSTSDGQILLLEHCIDKFGIDSALHRIIHTPITVRFFYGVRFDSAKTRTPKIIENWEI